MNQTGSASKPTAASTEGAHTPSVSRRGRIRSQSRWWSAWMFLAPALLLFIYFKFIPMAQGIRMSFQDVSPFLGNTWVGFENYIEVLTNERFHQAVRNTIVLGAGQSFGAVIIGFLLALLLEGPSRTLWFVRTAVFLPVVTASAVVGEIWRIIYYPAADGFLNKVIGLFGMDPIRYLEDTSVALYAVMTVGIWSSAPYYMVIFLAGLAGVDRSLYEAAAIDGARMRHRIISVTIPALRPAIMIVSILAAVRALRIFTDVWVLTGGGPAGSTQVWMTQIYTQGFERNNLGVASAASILLLIASVLLTFVAIYFTRNKEAK
ncbi:carbohydrate ABC transporter membrane protein 1, CUT1 family [Pacificibacter marinus]|uniref:Putative multiple-sugar transport system permease YteP n=2 Tax=Pacificibacter marinus TaxID=658057 RepID=A0A1Y5T8X8_9RHOB|nr:carbohydrate ABC transporter membrane protein 1, CUT1 family [Pacificibacter marinus]SLN58285.1 putative multiple-sugar transport system permease YteP [Pacificibacter marinus]